MRVNREQSAAMSVGALRRVDTPGAMLADPIGTAIVGRTFTLWVQSPERMGAIHTGAWELRDAQTIAELFPLFRHDALAPRYDILHDLGALNSINPSMFGFFETFLRGWIDVLVARGRRVAAVRPPGLIGGALGGLFHEWVAPRLDAKLCADPAEAYAFLGMTAKEIAQIEAERATVIGAPALRQVREAIANDPGAATLASVAARLGQSARTLQRQLGELGTSFRDELVRMRIEIAKCHLLDGDDKVASIARAVGFASNAAFSTAFQKIVGVTPSRFRAQRGAKP